MPVLDDLAQDQVVAGVTTLRRRRRAAADPARCSKSLVTALITWSTATVEKLFLLFEVAQFQPTKSSSWMANPEGPLK